MPNQEHYASLTDEERQIHDDATLRDESLRPEGLIDNEEKAQIEANFVRFTALRKTAVDEFRKENLSDHNMLSVFQEYRSLGLKMSPAQQEMYGELEAKLKSIEKEVLEGKRAVEPSRLNYQEAMAHWQTTLDEIDKSGPVGGAILRMMQAIGAKSIQKNLENRTENLSAEQQESSEVLPQK